MLTVMFRRAGALAILILAASAPLLPARAAPPIAVGATTDGVPSLAPMLEKVTPAVVNIAVRGHTAAQANPLANDPFFRRFFGGPGQPSQRQFRAAGSGVIVDADKGYVVTNNHVVRQADEIDVTLRDGRRLKATVVGTDPEADVAVIKVEAEGLQALPLGDSAKLKVGDFVVAVGNPFGLGQTVTSGIVSAVGRTGLGIEGYEDFIQTDASINPGNSGGALVNLRGQLVGINTAIVGPAGGNVGIGFAIPVNMATSIMDQLIEHGEVKRGMLGVQVQNISPEIAEALKLDATHGALVAKVEPGSAAERAGIKSGDVILKLNGKAVRDSADLRNRIGLARVGDKVKLRVFRDGQKMTVSTELGARRQTRVDGGTLDSRLAGAVFGQAPDQAEAGEAVPGAVVESLQQGSPAWRYGLREGDIVTAINHQPVGAPDDLGALVGKDQKVLLMDIRRGKADIFLAIQ